MVLIPYPSVNQRLKPLGVSSPTFQRLTSRQRYRVLQELADGAASLAGACAVAAVCGTPKTI